MSSKTAERREEYESMTKFHKPSEKGLILSDRYFNARRLMREYSVAEQPNPQKLVDNRA